MEALGAPGGHLGEALANLFNRPTGGSELLSAATWIVLALYLGYAPLAMVRRLRPWLWLAVVIINLALLVALGGVSRVVITKLVALTKAGAGGGEDGQSENEEGVGRAEHAGNMCIGRTAADQKRRMLRSRHPTWGYM